MLINRPFRAVDRIRFLMCYDTFWVFEVIFVCTCIYFSIFRAVELILLKVHIKEIKVTAKEAKVTAKGANQKETKVRLQ